MRGDQADFVARLRLTLPEGWFGDTGPVLGGLLDGLAEGWAWAFGLLQAVRQETRIATASGQFLDLACGDFFGRRLLRRAGEADAALRDRLRQAMRRERGTRAGLVAAAAVEGDAVRVFEPARPADTGAYGAAGGAVFGLAWGVAGGWGSLDMPLTCLVVTPGDVAAVGPALASALPAGGVAWVRTG